MGSSWDAESIDVEVTAEAGDRDGEWVLWWIGCIHRGYIMKITPYQPINTLKAAVFAAER